ncbi:MAG: NTP transferase domain-containing protein [Treponema sp.]|jgi:CTP:phosphocholine cytidylyltransferase-like protein|nr:NTP transferase domain-containing protein [Treponema sp.]
MELSRSQFDVLAFLEAAETSKLSQTSGTAQVAPVPQTQRGIARGTGLSVGTVNRVLAQLAEASLVERNREPPRISAGGIQALEPFRVKRAVFLAAGFGSRLVPITLNTPKSLVRVEGTRIIDTLLDAVVAAGIRDIVIVRGHLGEQFDQLLYKYPSISFLENPLYNESNNISSALCARYQLQNAYVLESDLLLRNPRLIAKYQYASNYLGVFSERTDDWCFETKNGVITKLRVGGRNCYHMFGISYWNALDGAKLAEHIRQVYEMPGGKERYWDQVALEYFSKEYEIEIRECTFDDITEIDTFSELKKIDKNYRG